MDPTAASAVLSAAVAPLEAWPVSYAVTDLSAFGTDVVLETIEITHEGVVPAQS